jgi:hypothetical protein
MTPSPRAAAKADLTLPPLLRSVLPRGARLVRRVPTKEKSTVLIVDCGGRALVAKKGTAAGLRCERDVYQRVLPTLGIRAPAVRAWADSLDETWLVIDYVEGRPPMLDDPADLRRVSTWVAQLHGASRAIGYPDPAPALGRPIPEERLAELRARIAGGDGADPDTGWALHACTEIERALPLIRQEATLLPECLGHGDLSDLNILLSRDAVVVVDWDQAARRSPAMDLSLVDVDSYCAQLCLLGHQGDARLVSQVQHAGIVLACLAHDLGRKPFKTQLDYLGRVVRAVRAVRSGTW